MDKIPISRQGFDALVKELKDLKEVQRPEILKTVQWARSLGDLSENAEYDAAKEAQGMLELKIAKLQETIKNSRVLDKSQIQSDKVQILSKVKLLNVKTKAEVTYTIVAGSEANLKEGKISIETPIAKGLLGKKKGESAKIKVPAGELEFKILEIGI